MGQILNTGINLPAGICREEPHHKYNCAAAQILCTYTLAAPKAIYRHTPVCLRITQQAGIAARRKIAHRQFVFATQNIYKLRVTFFPVLVYNTLLPP